MGKTFSTGLLTNGIWQDSSNNIGIGAAASGSYKLQVTGTTNLTGALSGTSATFSGVITGQTNGNTFGTASTTGRGIIVQAGSSNQAIMLKNALGGDGTIFATGDATSMNYAFNTYSTGDALVIKNNGNVGIGTTSPTGLLSLKASLSDTPALRFQNNITSGLDAALSTYVSSTQTYLAIGTNCYINSTGNIVRFNTSYESSFIAFDEGNLRFATGTTSANPSTKMTITSGGNVGIGSTGDVAQKLRIQGIDTGTSNYGLVVADSTTASTMFVRNDGYGYLKASAWAYGSDIRLKENIYDVENGLDMVLKMKPKHFDYINGTKDNLGFIAQEIQEIIPQAISETPDGTLALKTDFLVPYLVKAIQELSAQNQDLKSRLDKAGL